MEQSWNIFFSKLSKRQPIMELRWSTYKNWVNAEVRLEMSKWLPFIEQR